MVEECGRGEERKRERKGKKGTREKKEKKEKGKILEKETIKTRDDFQTNAAKGKKRKKESSPERREKVGERRN